MGVSTASDAACFVLVLDAPLDEEQWPNITYTPDMDSAMTEAKRAAGERNVLVIVPRALNEGLLDELEIQLIPVLLGGGRRLFDVREHIELERTRVLEGEGDVTHLHYRVIG
ncbi:MAG TPA: hypothetical protein VE569_10665 [Acidimicrobiia bacterium]|nr:hypothetical protein [Acidimicrobiia bacterium]